MYECIECGDTTINKPAGSGDTILCPECFYQRYPAPTGYDGPTVIYGVEATPALAKYFGR